MSFIGRAYELSLLHDLLKKKTASLVVIKGRRRIGKSRLIAEFGKNFRMLSLIGIPPEDGVSAQQQRDSFAMQLAQNLAIPKPNSEDWSYLFWQLAEQTKKGRVIILLDEISWMGAKDPTFLGKLKTVWDTHLKQNNQLILVLCGSVSSWIEKNILSSSGFVGRITLKITLTELPLRDCNKFWGKTGDHISNYEKFKFLAVTGGIPNYLEFLIPSYMSEENIKRLCFMQEGALFNEFEQIFHDLFDKRSNLYQQILITLIKNPHAELADFYQELKTDRQGIISTYLDDLQQAGFIQRDYTWYLKNGLQAKASHYRICDNYVRFYLKYISPNKNKVKRDVFLSRSISLLPGWEAIMGLQFENLVLNNRKHLYQLLHIDPADIVFDNPYFQTKTNRQQSCQIDYMIQTKYNHIYVCEIKFSKHAVPISVIKEVQEKIAKIKLPKNFSYRPVLIHVNGVSDQILAEEYFSDIIDFGQFLKTN